MARTKKGSRISGAFGRSATPISRRREHRRRSFVAIVLGLGLATILFLPTLASYCGVGEMMLVRSVSDRGWRMDAESVRMGWITPLRIRGLVMTGPSGETLIEVDQIEATHTIIGMMRGQSADQLGVVKIDGLRLEASVASGTSSIERDLASFLDSDGDQATVGTIDVQQMDIGLTDVETNQRWSFNGGGGSVHLDAAGCRIDAEGVVSDPRGHAGRLNTTIDVSDSSSVTIAADLDSLPLSILNLASRRGGQFDGATASFDGDATGRIQLAIADENVDVVTDHVTVRQWASAIPIVDNNARSRIMRTQNSQAEIDGTWTMTADRWIARDCFLSTDFATFEVSASASRRATAASMRDPLAIIQTVAGRGRGEIDLVAFERAMPSVLPLQRGARLEQAVATVAFDNQPGQGLCRLEVQTSPLVGQTVDGVVRLDPIDLNADVRVDGRHLTAERLVFESSFGRVTGHGDLAAGELDFDIRLDDLSSRIGSLIDAARFAPSGATRGNVRWEQRERRWHLDGNAVASNFGWGSRPGESGSTFDFDTRFSAVGRWDAVRGTLASLDSAELQLDADPSHLTATLVEPTADPLSGRSLPFEINADADAALLRSLLIAGGQAIAPEVDGQIRFRSIASLGPSAVTVGRTRGKWQNARVRTADSDWRQSEIEFEMDGDIDLSTGVMVVREAVVVAPAMTANVRGQADRGGSHWDINLRTELSRLNAMMSAASSGAGTAATQSSVASQTVSLRRSDPRGSEFDRAILSGAVTGDIALDFVEAEWLADTQLEVTDFHVQQRDSTGDGNRSSTLRTVWYEPKIEINGTFAEPRKPSGSSDRTISMRDVSLRGHWFASTVQGECLMHRGNRDMEVRCEGPTMIDMEVVASKLSDVIGYPVAASGLTQSDMRARWSSGSALRPELGQSFDIAGDISWDNATIAGFAMGEANVPVHLTQSRLRIDPATIPVGQGRMHVAGDVMFDDGPLRLELPAGRIADNIELSPEMTGTWMKYLAPVVAGATNVAGTVSAEIDGGVVLIDDPRRSRVAGRLQIERATMSAGPMVDRLLAGVDQARSLASGSSPTGARATGRTLVTMPPQVVEFAMRDGVISHDRMFFGIDRAEVVTSGSVDVDGRINLVAQIPIEAAWVGRDLGPLAGRPLTLPVSGTLSQIQVDTAAVGKLITEAVVTAGQSEVNRYLDKQIGRGLDKLLGR